MMGMFLDKQGWGCGSGLLSQAPGVVRGDDWELLLTAGTVGETFQQRPEPDYLPMVVWKGDEVVLRKMPQRQDPLCGLPREQMVAKNPVYKILLPL